MKVKKATAELTEMATGMISQIGSSGETLDRLHNVVEEERERASGRARVARDSMNLSDIDLKESEQKALADQALAQFAADAGIVLEPTPGASTPQRESIGPTGSNPTAS